MIPALLPPALANHLWQSTLFAGAAWLLVLTLHKTAARVRYWVWLTASVKFLVPFSLLVAAGMQLRQTTGSSVVTRAIPAAMQEVGEPFTASSATLAPAGEAPRGASWDLLPEILFTLWLCGSAGISISWWVRWRRLRRAVRSATPIALEAAVPVLSSPAPMEPGIVGIFRPVLLLPEGIRERLGSAQLKAILAHETCHVRRRDNLTAAIHMAGEALFWFHPLIWWLGARLVEERERACDEAVIQLGNDPGVYAESILKTCQFCLESPLACAPGVTGSDLKTRVSRIMAHRTAPGLAWGKRLLLIGAGTAAIGVPMAFGLMNAPQSQAQSTVESSGVDTFEVASVKPNKSGDRGARIGVSPGDRFRATNVNLKMLIRMAYAVQDFQISGGPGWLDSDRYDIEAKGSSFTSARPAQANDDERKSAEEHRRRQVRALLADRFQLKIREETQEAPIYVLVVAKGGPKLHPSAVTEMNAAMATDKAANGPVAFKGMRMGRGQISAQDTPLDMLVGALSTQTGRTVVDKTGLKGHYDFTLRWTPDESQGQMFKGGPEPGPAPDPSGPSLFTALQEQLGLKLEAQKGPVEMLIIENAEKPSEN